MRILKFQHIVSLIRLVLFFLVLFLISRKFNLSETTAYLRHVNVHYLPLLFLLFLLKYFLAGFRWSYIATNIMDIRNACTCYYLRSFLEITFLRLAVPIPDAEDILKFYKMHIIGIAKTININTIILDRMAAILTLVLVVPYTIALLFATSSGGPIRWLLCVITTVVTLFAAYQFKALVSRIVGIIKKKGERAPLPVRKIRNVLNQLVSIEYRTREMAGLLMLVAAYYLIIAAVLFVLVAAFGVHIAYYKLALTIPIIIIAPFLPISYQGIGLMESAIIGTLIIFDVPADLSIAIGTIHFAFEVLVIVIGGCLYLYSDNRLEYDQLKNALLKIRFYFKSV